MPDLCPTKKAMPKAYKKRVAIKIECHYHPTKPQENSYILAKKLMKNREVPILSPPDPYFDVFDLGINTHIGVHCN